MIYICQLERCEKLAIYKLHEKLHTRFSCECLHAVALLCINGGIALQHISNLAKSKRTISGSPLVSIIYEKGFQ